MPARNMYAYSFVLVVLFAAPVMSHAADLTLYVDARSGSDSNAGTRDEPLKTIRRAAELARGKTESGPTTITLAPGVYTLTQPIEFDANIPYTAEGRLTIQALVLPDDPQWLASLMPVILSTEDPRETGQINRLTETYCFRIKISHVTIRGLRFLGNPLLHNWHCPVSRIGNRLHDLRVTQCMFVGDPEGLDIYCAALAAGDGFVVDHCIFYNCNASVVFWDGEEGVPGRGNAMRYCVVDGAGIAGVWTCQTADDFEFHHNVVTRSEYFWLRKSGTPIRYRLSDCIVTDNKHYSGYGVPSGPTGETGPEVTFAERNVVKEGEPVLEISKRSRNYLHVVSGSPGGDLGAGLFTK